MKSLIFDTGPVISLTMNNLLWLLKPLKEGFGGDFYLTPRVKVELVDKPLQIKRFKWEALQVDGLIKEGVFEVLKTRVETGKLLNLANRCFKARGRWIRILQEAEVESVVASLKLKNEGVVIDERTIRFLVEDPRSLASLLEKRLHCKVRVNKEAVKRFREQFKGLKIIRSIELVGVAYRLGLLDKLIPKVKEGKQVLLDAVFWGVKTDGCAVTGKEIEEMKRVLR